MMMIMHNDYLRNMLGKVLESYDTIQNLQNKPGDLNIMHQELLRIKGIMQVIVNKIEPKHYPSVDIEGLSSRAKSFLNDYYFEREIEIMRPLYENDPGRLKHMHYKILEALHDKDLISKIQQLSAEI